MPVVIDEVVVDVPSSESTAPAAGAPASGGPAWSPELARALDEQLRIAVERRERVIAD